MIKEKAHYPKIKFTDTHFYIIFKQNPEYLKMASPQKTPQKIITDLEQKIINLIIENPKTSRKQIALSLDISEDTVKEYLERLKKKGLLKRIGSAKGGHWEIIKES